MKNFQEINSKKSVNEQEEEVLEFWEREGIFVKTVDGEDGESRKGRESYTFFDGPPFATGLPHYGHIVGTVLKDVVPRYQTMRGRRVERKWGWDCHGLPIENIVEKELGSKSKKDIEEMGVEVFNEKCRAKVLEYASEWEKIIPRIGRWADMKNAYRTMDRDYMESVWWVFAQLYEKDLIYKSYRSMHVCPRCETTLSQSEVSEGYKDVKDLSVIAKFKLKTGQKIAGEEIGENTFVLAWTTTPWTLPGNVALAVGEDIEYVKLVAENSLTGKKESLIIASDRWEYFKSFDTFPINQFKFDIDGNKAIYKDIEECHILEGSDLTGLEYEPLYNAYARDEELENRENGWRIYGADFVTTDSGTGVVHIAPAFGEDDMALGKEKDLPFVQHIGMDGIMKSEVGEVLGGGDVKPRAKDKPEEIREIDLDVKKDLDKRGLLFNSEKYTHSYPHCWRCDTALLNYATSSWFVAVTKIKDKLLETAQDINWSPAHIKEGRFGKWLEGARDWSISRQRFWASVMPIWVCDGCEEKKVFGEVAELEKLSGQKIDDLHKHIVDKVTFACAKCETGVMRRVPDVLDTWFDSGAMPYAQMHYPFENQEKFAQSFPADFIAEGQDQARTWFYYLHVLAGGLFGKRAFSNVIVSGIALAEDGKKMSKKLQNYPDPMKMVTKYGADVMRVYLMSSPLVSADNLSFSEKEMAELSRGMFRMLRQSYGFFVMYANVDGWSAKPKTKNQKSKSENILDRWIVARLGELVREVNTQMEVYNMQKSARAFAPFVDDLSNWYIRRSRARFWKSEDDGDKNDAYTTLHFVLVEFAKTIAPFAPFIAEEIYRNLTSGIDGAKESVHLEDFPQIAQNEIDKQVIVQMANAREIITQGLELRARAEIKVRQPLPSLLIKNQKDEIGEDLIAIIREELNVKQVNFCADVAIDRGHGYVVWSDDKSVGLDLEITPELKLEGQAREIIRYIQSARKKAGFNIDDRIVLGYVGLKKVFANENLRKLIAHEVLATEVIEGELESPEHTQEVKIDDEVLNIFLKRN